MSDNWSFTDSREWESVSKWFADGVEQSPVNISTNNLIQCKSLCDAEFKYKPSKCKVNFKNNNQITIVTNCGWGNNITGVKWVRKNYASRSKYLEEIIHNDRVKIKNFITLIKYFSKNHFNIIEILEIRVGRCSERPQAPILQKNMS